MTTFAFDANIVIDALGGIPEARVEMRRAVSMGGRLWISRMAWIEVMSKGDGPLLQRTEAFLSGFAIDEVDEQIATRAASLRRERPRLRSPDAIILASAVVRGRILVTRNTKDFPASMPGIRVPYSL
ncbi:type II toxin-antitoxin system VapC family toxin [Novosphingobium resinovorum]|uniref:type II toxin-antitoxin system VapC family toxin n=1 Tax=Novosphingobium resinovorum TaxID=158500 RepID=UPI002ED52045|nr:type II toxin-antitoxin system VapC family toxin [Novosphingobium resinovorum]